MSGRSSITKVVGFRVPHRIADELEQLANLKNVDKSELFRRWVSEGYASEIRRLGKESPAA